MRLWHVLLLSLVVAGLSSYSTRGTPADNAAFAQKTSRQENAVESEPPAGHSIRGVVTSITGPLADALVTLQGFTEHCGTAQDGTFVLRTDERSGLASYVTAAHEGFYTSRAAITDGLITIQLHRIPASSARNDYAWKDPHPSTTNIEACGNCHGRVYREWHTDAHSNSATNPVFLSYMKGTDLAGVRQPEPGYVDDYAGKQECLSCHAPLSHNDELRTQQARLSLPAPLSITCDFCHKISQVVGNPVQPTLDDLVLQLPPAGSKLLFGPIQDATFVDDEPEFSYSTAFRDSRFCGACHNGGSAGLQVYTTYSEWYESVFRRNRVECQSCHMRPPTNATHMADDHLSCAVSRQASSYGSHATMSGRREDFIRSATTMDVKYALRDGRVHVNVLIENAGAGHHFPTGSPLRNAILTIQAADADGKPLALVSGGRVPAWGGSGTGSDSLAGRPGKGYAKILQQLHESTETDSPAQKSSPAELPSPQWRANGVLIDSRIPAGTSDETAYEFTTAEARSPFVLDIRLVYRRAFKDLADRKQWPLRETEIQARHFVLECDE
jgi:hypothetical protein